ncbi:MAG: hypothetical protein WKG01_07555 [Kofleriaceae bacterium]
MTLLDRRTWLQWTGGAAIAVVAGGCRHHAQPDEQIGPAMIAPEVVGKLAPHTAAALWALFGSIGEHWGLWDGPARRLGTRAWFDDVLALKTGRAPSYLGEYRNAAAVLAERGLDTLYAAPVPRARPPQTRLDHVRTYVAAELVALFVTIGGLHRFGYRAYFGYEAGPLSTQPFR